MLLFLQANADDMGVLGGLTVVGRMKAGSRPPAWSRKDPAPAGKDAMTPTRENKH